MRNQRPTHNLRVRKDRDLGRSGSGSVVPIWVVDRIIEAIEFGNSIELKELIVQEVMLCSPILGQRLLELANNYSYKGIEEILKRGEME